MNMEFSQEEIDVLIGCPKVIVEPPRKEMQLTQGHYRNDIKLKSQDGKHDFSVFMRRNQDFQENFSVGLVYAKGWVELYRCNGPHGGHLGLEHHDTFHVHSAKAESIAAGLKPDRTAFVSEEYATYDEALVYFLKKCNILDYQNWFPKAVQKPLPLK